MPVLALVTPRRHGRTCPDILGVWPSGPRPQLTSHAQEPCTAQGERIASALRRRFEALRCDAERGVAAGPRASFSLAPALTGEGGEVGKWENEYDDDDDECDDDDDDADDLDLGLEC